MPAISCLMMNVSSWIGHSCEHQREPEDRKQRTLISTGRSSKRVFRFATTADRRQTCSDHVSHLDQGSRTLRKLAKFDSSISYILSDICCHSRKLALSTLSRLPFASRQQALFRFGTSRRNRGAPVSNRFDTCTKFVCSILDRHVWRLKGGRIYRLKRV
jgi:hypothetical protein